MNETNAQPQSTLTPAQIDKLEIYAKLLRTAAIGLEQSAQLLDRTRTTQPRPHVSAPSAN